MRVVVLGGAGAMGQVSVRDLAESAVVDEVVIADASRERSLRVQHAVGSAKVSLKEVDLNDQGALVQVLQGAEVVINATAHRFNIQVMEAALAAACNYVDLGGLFYETRKQLQFDQRFKDSGLVAVIGMGAAPGMTNVMAAEAAQALDSLHTIDIVVAGVDFNKTSHPFLPPYALETVLDEYALEPMVYEAGQFLAKAPMSGESWLNLPAPVGSACVFLTLHSEIATLPLSYRYKGVQNVTYRLGLPAEFHEKAKFLVQLGFASQAPLIVDQVSVNPRRVLAKIVDSWGQEPDREAIKENPEPDDCEIIRVDVTGMLNGQATKVRMESQIRSRADWHVSAGALDTGVPPSVVAQMIAAGEIACKGVVAPEICVEPGRFFAELSKRLIPMTKIFNPDS